MAALAGYFCVYSLNDLLDLQGRPRRDQGLLARPAGLEAGSGPHGHHDAPASGRRRSPAAVGGGDLGRHAGGDRAGRRLSAPAPVRLAVHRLRRARDPVLQPAPAHLAQSHTRRHDGRRRRACRLVRRGHATWGALAFFFLLYGWETGRNLTNDLADVVHDRLVGITTLASTHGPSVASKAILGDGMAMVVIALAQPVDLGRAGPAGGRGAG